MPHRWYSIADGYSAAELIGAARDHLYSAEILFGHSFACLDSAGYLGHLSLEVATKAALLERTGRFPNSHDLHVLFGLLREECGLILTVEGTTVIEKLNAFSELRYPERGLPEIGSDDFQDLEHSFWQVVTCFPELKNYLESRDHTRKAGRVLMVKDHDFEAADS